MNRPTYSRICLSILLKYLFFYTILMVLNNDFKLLQINNIHDGGDLFYYLWIVLFFPIVDFILFSAPLYLSFKIKYFVNFTCVFVLILIVEYFVYAFFTSQKIYSRDSLIKVIINIIVLFIMFRKKINNYHQRQG